MLGTATAIIAGFGGPLHPAFDTLSNFRLHLSAGLVLLAVAWSFRCSRAPAFIFALIGFFGVASASSGLPLQPGTYHPQGDETVHTAFVMNLRWNNPGKEAIAQRILELDPDIVLLTEHSYGWADALRPLDERYPHKLDCPEWGIIGGSTILSKFPPSQNASPTYCGFYASAGFTGYQINGQPVTLGIVHLRWPWPASGPEMIDRLEPALRELPENALIAGDFNSATWTHSVRRFARMGALDVVDGIGPTWAPGFVIGGSYLQFPRWTGLPIDNAMAKGNVRIVSAKRLEDLGSDHLPIVIEFVVSR